MDEQPRHLSADDFPSSVKHRFEWDVLAVLAGFACLIWLWIAI